MAHDQGRSVYPGNDISHGECLTAAGNPEQCLVLKAPIKPRHQLLHRLGLVTGHLKIRDYFKGWHTNSIAFRGLFIYLTPLIPLSWEERGKEIKKRGSASLRLSESWVIKGMGS
jgi:hypothetical protein